MAARTRLGPGGYPVAVPASSGPVAVSLAALANASTRAVGGLSGRLGIVARAKVETTATGRPSGSLALSAATRTETRAAAAPKLSLIMRALTKAATTARGATSSGASLIALAVVAKVATFARGALSLAFHTIVNPNLVLKAKPLPSTLKAPSSTPDLKAP